MIIGIPLYMGRKIHDNFKFASRIKRNLAVTCGVVGSVILSPALAVLVRGNNFLFHLMLQTTLPPVSGR